MRSLFYGADLGDSVVAFFSKLSVTALFLILTGLMLLVIEMFRSSKWKLAIPGASILLSGVVLRMLSGGTPGMLLLMLLLSAGILLLSHILALLLQKRQWLYQSVNWAIGEQTDEQDDYEFLVGLIGVATTDINEEGSMAINDVTFFVCAQHFIERGSKVCVVSVDGEKIFVKKEGR